MKDVFKEQLIKRPMVFRDHVIFSGSVAAAIFLSYFAFLFMDGFAFMAIGVMCFILYYVFIMLKKEFEYSFTNGELDIDCIYGQRKRKRKFTCEVRDVGFLIHSSNATRDNELSAAEVVLDFGTGTVCEKTWYLLTSYNGRRTKVVFEPNEAMLAAFKGFISPRKVFGKI